MLKLGIVGFSKGNGHPISWAAACNGYSKKNFHKIPFKRIADYLPKYDLEICKINDAKVTHIWTQDYNYSKLIAKISNINTVCKKLKDLHQNVDAILFLRDDIESREKYLIELIKTGKPIYIDKFIHYEKKKIHKFFKLQKYEGQIFSESSLVNNKKIILNKNELDEIGKIIYINASSPGNWKNYAIHIIDPCLKFIKNRKIKNISSTNSKFLTSVSIKWQNDLITNFSTIQNSNFIASTEIIGLKKKKIVNWELDYVFDDFITTIRKFIFLVKNSVNVKKKEDAILVAKIIKAGIQK